MPEAEGRQKPSRQGLAQFLFVHKGLPATQPHPLTDGRPVVAFPPPQQSCAFATDTVRSANPKTLTVWLLTEKLLSPDPGQIVEFN